MSNAVVPMQDIMKMAEAVAKSGLFGVKDANQALALMLVAQAEGRHPALAARDYDIIQGRPAKKTEAMLRDFLENSGKVEWHELTDAIADATFSHPSGGSVRIAWDMKRAGAAGLAGRDMWRKFPRQMLRSRTVSEGIRTVCPMATSGMYVPEEIRDIVEKDVTPATPRGGAKERLTQAQIDKVNATAATVGEFVQSGAIADAGVELDSAALDADEMVYFWDQFDAKEGKLIAEELKKIRRERRAKAALPPPDAAVDPDPTQAIPEKAVAASPVISSAAHKRLEARIKELGADRDKLKVYVMEKFGIAHLNELTKDAYAAVDKMLDKKAAAKPVATDAADIPARITACATLEALEALADSFTEAEAVAHTAAYGRRKSELLDAEGGL